MMQTSGGTDLSLETFKKLGILFSSEDLDGHLPLDVRIIGAIYAAKSATSDLSLDSIFGDLR